MMCQRKAPARYCFQFGKDADPDIPVLKEAKAEYAEAGQTGMYGPPLCRKRKMKVTGWSAQMYSAFVGAQSSWP